MTIAIPHEVGVALRFVEMCNVSMGFRLVPGYKEASVYEAELHPAQEWAFDRACELLGRYFQDGQERILGVHHGQAEPGHSGGRGPAAGVSDGRCGLPGGNGCVFVGPDGKLVPASDWGEAVQLVERLVRGQNGSKPGGEA